MCEHTIRAHLVPGPNSKADSIGGWREAGLQTLLKTRWRARTVPPGGLGGTVARSGGTGRGGWGGRGAVEQGKRVVVRSRVPASGPEV